MRPLWVSHSLRYIDICTPSFKNLATTAYLLLTSIWFIRYRTWYIYLILFNIQQDTWYKRNLSEIRAHTIPWHVDVIKLKHFPRNWPFVRGIHRSPVNPPHKGQWRGALMFSLICVWINDWVNNHEAGDLRRYRAHYDVIVMVLCWHDYLPMP